MPDEVRTVCYDADLQVEAYRFQGLMQKFPHHFHDYYVIGFIENGKRRMQCNGRDCIIHPGDIILFNPRDVHSCEQVDDRPMDYRSLNINPDSMRRMVREITGADRLPRFAHNVLAGSELAAPLQELHQRILNGESDFVKEELMLFLIGQLLQEYSDITKGADEEKGESVYGFEAVCEYMDTHYEAKITLDQLSELAGLSKYYFLRSFTRLRGLSPYSYLETIRVGRAKKLLEQGLSPADAASRTGFSDQSHFTNFFKRYIGLTPGQYMRIFAHNASDRRALSWEGP